MSRWFWLSWVANNREVGQIAIGDDYDQRELPNKILSKYMLIIKDEKCVANVIDLTLDFSHDFGALPGMNTYEMI